MKRADASLEDSAKAFVHSKLGVKPEAMQFRSGYSAETVKHTYLKQMHDGIHFANAVANVAFNHDGKVVAFGSSFVKPSQSCESDLFVDVY
jgi:extracellular elastinolytic metalloproteinase